jgi:hypothetical protein
MQSAIVDLCCVRIAVVLVDRDDIEPTTAPKLIRKLQPRFGGLPILLVYKPDTSWDGARAYSDFPTDSYFAALILNDDTEWGPLPPEPEEELPF